MNLTVEWADELYPDSNENSVGVAGQFPVIRVDALRKWMEQAKREELARTANDDRIMLLDDLLAQLPEA